MGIIPTDQTEVPSPLTAITRMAAGVSPLVATAITPTVVGGGVLRLMATKPTIPTARAQVGTGTTPTTVMEVHPAVMGRTGTTVSR